MSVIIFTLGFTAGVILTHPYVISACVQFYRAAAATAPDAPVKAMMKIVWDQTVLRLEQYFRRSVVPVEGTDQWKVHYYIQGKQYIITVRSLKGPIAAAYTPEIRGKLSIVLNQ